MGTWGILILCALHGEALSCARACDYGAWILATGAAQCIWMHGHPTVKRDGSRVPAGGGLHSRKSVAIASAEDTRSREYYILTLFVLAIAPRSKPALSAPAHTGHTADFRSRWHLA